MARNVNVDPTMPRVAGRQIHLCNAPADLACSRLRDSRVRWIEKRQTQATADNPEQYYQRNVAVPLINHLKAELDEQFSGNEFSG